MYRRAFYPSIIFFKSIDNFAIRNLARPFSNNGSNNGSNSSDNNSNSSDNSGNSLTHDTSGNVEVGKDSFGGLGLQRFKVTKFHRLTSSTVDTLLVLHVNHIQCLHCVFNCVVCKLSANCRDCIPIHERHAVPSRAVVFPRPHDHDSPIQTRVGGEPPQ